MAEFSSSKISTEEEATNHLFMKLKYDLVVNMWDKMVRILSDSKDKTTFVVGSEQRSYPTNLVKALSKITSRTVVVKGGYTINELVHVFEILMKLPAYKCSGLTQDYEDWQPVSSLLNMTELAAKFGMQEVETFLKRVPELLTESNRNMYNTEKKRREEKNDTAMQTEAERSPSPTGGRHRRRTKSRSNSLSRILYRSLSRSKKSKRDN